jgi:hypothetical protein
MDDLAALIVDHYERHALSWDADRRAAGWNDKCWIERFLDSLPQGATTRWLKVGRRQQFRRNPLPTQSQRLTRSSDLL